MAYITTERVAEIRKELKTLFPAFKFSITRDGYSGVRITVLEAPVLLTAKKYEEVNQYYLGRHEGEKGEILRKIAAVANDGVTLYETGDYGSQPSHYTYIKIGDYDKPFKYVVRNERAKPLFAVKLKSLKTA